MLAADPTLLEERGNHSVTDPFGGVGASFLFLATVVTAAFDSSRFQWTRPFSAPVETLALILWAGMTGLQIWAMAVNLLLLKRHADSGRARREFQVGPSTYPSAYPACFSSSKSPN